MRVTQSEIYRNFMSDIETLSDASSRIGRQVTSGKKLNQLKDSPSGSAELVSLTKLASEIDQYRSNTDKGSLYLNVADSALNEVTNLLSSIYNKGSQASADTVNDEARAALAYEVRSLREQIVSLANSEVNGRFLFAGSLSSSINIAPPSFALSNRVAGALVSGFFILAEQSISNTATTGFEPI